MNIKDIKLKRFFKARSCMFLGMSFVLGFILLFAGIGEVRGYETYVYVNPEDSIQVAIDSICPEGGVVEFAEGTWNITSSLNIIQRNNLTLKGAGVDKTVLSTNEEDMCVIIASALEDNDFIIHEEGGGAAQQDPRLKNAPFYYNITIKDIRLIGPGIRVPAGNSIYGILYAKMANSTIKNVVVEKFGDGILLYRSNDNTLKGIEIVDSNRGALFFSASENNTVESCLFEHSNRWYAFDLNGHCKNNKIIGNIFKGNGQGDLKIYSGSTNNRVRGNTFDGAGGSNCGVVIMNGAWNLIQGNVFTNHRKATEYASIVQRSGGGSHPPEHYNHDNKIINNVFYASKGDAILRVVGAHIEVRNNIIVQNQGAGLVGTDLDFCSYNNLWGNIEGNEGGGVGSISVDPLFADPVNNDFHLKSQYGRWNGSGWVCDPPAEHSPCLDAGNPDSDCSQEPPENGGRINMGAYGNTDKASLSGAPELDNTPPAAVTNLSAGNATSGSITLTWTAPGDDGNSGRASVYDIRYSVSAITAGNWGSAAECSGEPAPQTAGSTESFTVTGFFSNTTCHFAMRTADENPNWSAISNCPNAKTTEEINKVFVFPNPYVKGKSVEEKICFSNLPKEATLRVYTISGKLVKKIIHKSTSDGGSEKLDISGIASGVYIYTIISPSGKKKGKLSIAN